MTYFRLNNLPQYSKSILFLLFVSLGSLFGQTVYEQLELISPFPTANHIEFLGYGNGKFLAATDRGGILLSSDDGITWNSHDTTYANALNDVAYGNGLYCVATGGSGPAFFSSDLANWSMVSSSILPSNSDNVYFANGLFFMGGAPFGNNPGIVTTADGVTFNNPTTPQESTIRDIIFANGLYVTV